MPLHDIDLSDLMEEEEAPIPFGVDQVESRNPKPTNRAPQTEQFNIGENAKGSITVDLEGINAGLDECMPYTPGPKSCAQTCMELEEARKKECDKLRIRVADLLKKRGCPTKLTPIISNNGCPYS